jgi:hypothetical protein
MRIHLCRVHSCRAAARALAEGLRAEGFAVTSRWLERDHETEREEWDPGRRAVRRFSDIVSADACVLIRSAHARSISAPDEDGEFELGVAVGLNRLCAVVTQVPRPHHYLPGILRVGSFEELRHALSQSRRDPERAALLHAGRGERWFLE